MYKRLIIMNLQGKAIYSVDDTFCRAWDVKNDINLLFINHPGLFYLI